MRGLGKQAVQNILEEYGINRVLAKEGGRTSRGSVRLMGQYIQFLNGLTQDDSTEFRVELLAEIEAWWIQKVRDFFQAKPFKFNMHDLKSLSWQFHGLFLSAKTRQKGSTGTMYLGAMLQHLIGAALRINSPGLNIPINGFSVKDEDLGRFGDFEIGDTCIHITTSPSISLLEKCLSNIEVGLKPLVITTRDGVVITEALIENNSLEGQIEVLDIIQYLVSDIYHKGGFSKSERQDTLKALIQEYNQIIESCETDPSLKIEIV